jgi:4'-phosphopantetheinyl transferase
MGRTGAGGAHRGPTGVSTVQVWWSSLVVADRALLGLIDADEQARVAALLRPADQGRSLVAAALLRVAVGEWLRVPPTAVMVDRSCAECGAQHGRPQIMGPGVDPPQVSVSHSGTLIVVAVATTQVGVDVQRVAEMGADQAGALTAEQWAAMEACRKLEAPDRAVVRALAPLLDGYAAAIAMPPDPPGVIRPLDIRTWPAGILRSPAS